MSYSLLSINNNGTMLTRAILLPAPKITLLAKFVFLIFDSNIDKIDEQVDIAH